MSVQKDQKPPICSAGSINTGQKLAAPVKPTALTVITTMMYKLMIVQYSSLHPSISL